MDVLPNIDLSDVMEIPKVFQCDEQTLPCDHTTKYRTITGRAAKNIKFVLSKIGINRFLCTVTINTIQE
jgi:hypothetical protein